MFIKVYPSLSSALLPYRPGCTLSLYDGCYVKHVKMMIHFYTWCLIVHSTLVLHRGSITVFLWSKIEMCDIDVCYRYTYWWHRVVDTYVSYLIISSILSLVNRIIFYRCNGERQIICKRYIDLSIISHIPHI